MQRRARAEPPRFLRLDGRGPHPHPAVLKPSCFLPAAEGKTSSVRRGSSAWGVPCVILCAATPKPDPRCRSHQKPSNSPLKSALCRLFPPSASCQAGVSYNITVGQCLAVFFVPKRVNLRSGRWVKPRISGIPSALSACAHRNGWNSSSPWRGCCGEIKIFAYCAINTRVAFLCV